jgi:hypothetical protein
MRLQGPPKAFNTEGTGGTEVLFLARIESEYTAHHWFSPVNSVTPVLKSFPGIRISHGIDH